MAETLLSRLEERLEGIQPQGSEAEEVLLHEDFHGVVELHKDGNSHHHIVIRKNGQEHHIHFSYKTPVAVWTQGEKPLVSHNNWGITTGKHLNQIHPDKKLRVPHEHVLKRIAEIIG